MPYNYNKNLVDNARELRKNMTPEEKEIWYKFLKKLPITVKRQQSIGEYIVDFYIAKAKTVIEIDGRQHGSVEHVESDKIRDEYLTKLGIRVLRYKNIDVNNRFYAVCRDILKHIDLTESDINFK